MTEHQEPESRDFLRRLRLLADSTTVPTGILCEVPFALQDIRQHRGTAGADPLDQTRWQQLYADLHRGVLPGSVESSSLPTPDEITSRASAVRARGAVPIAVADLAYNHLSERLTSLLLANARGEAPATPPEDPASPDLASESLTSEDLASELHGARAYFASAILPALPDFTFGFLPHQWPDLEITYCLPPELFLHNTGGSPVTFTLDAGDGNGPRAVAFGELVPVTYDSPGGKTVRIVAGYPDETLEAAFSIDVGGAVGTPHWDDKWEFQATIPYLGQVGTGIAYILYGSDSRRTKHTRLVNPIVLADGFPGHHYEYIYEILNTNRFLQTMLEHGYDAVLLTYGNGHDYIQRNAFAAVECVRRVIRAREPAKNPHPLIVGGASMGGIITRYALAYMEQEGIDHQTDVWLSLDAPHQGANVPPGGAHQILCLATVEETAKEKAALLLSPAAQQLVYYSTPSAESWDTGPSVLHRQFYAELRALNHGTGYPQRPRRIALADGAGDGRKVVPDHALTLSWSMYLNTTKGKTWALPTGAGQLSSFQLPFKNELWCKISGAVNYDGAPGGTSDYNGQIAKALLDSGANVEHYYDNPCFVPTVSAIDLANSGPYTPVPAEGADTPFTDYFVSSRNRPHVEMSTEMCRYLYAIFGITPRAVAWSYSQSLFVQEGRVTSPWTEIPATPKTSAFALEGDRIAWITASGALVAQEGSAGPVSLIPAGCYSVAMSAGRLAALSLDGSFNVMEGTLSPANWRNQWPNSISKFAIEGDRMLVSRQAGTNILYGTEGPLATPDWREIASLPGQIYQILMWGDRIAVLCNDPTTRNALWVKEGDLRAGWALKVPNVHSFALQNDRLAVITDQNELRVTQGPLKDATWHSLWRSDAHTVKLDGDRIGLLTGQSDLLVREGSLDDTRITFQALGKARSFALHDRRVGVIEVDDKHTVKLQDGALSSPWQPQPQLIGRAVLDLQLGEGSHAI
ncbi:lipase family protein [Actinacidiphila oryziradicis]|uniref:DUF676 domain-containing protein n=1 Tax=Actinacidiphila oryziradicis TaxID=2571141 RepID=A0A4U0RK45_9ACTN|nr:hypothetical protein [Actinacidiphila oryziradicis]TJZ96025.1 hypothetical protein FCI23_51595 [Actinacidiphila oryziradicis]